MHPYGKVCGVVLVGHYLTLDMPNVSPGYALRIRGDLPVTGVYSTSHKKNTVTACIIYELLNVSPSQRIRSY
jgi:hypothetical protein